MASSRQIVESLNKQANNKEKKIQKEKSSGYFFRSPPLKINAKPEQIWPIVKNVKKYAELSQGAVTAHVEGPLEVGKTITLELYKNKYWGKWLPPSIEIISVMNDSQKIVAWERQLPIGGKTERYQFLDPISENQTRSSIILRVPGPIGFFTKLFLNKIIKSSFQCLNEGIKKEAEKTCLKV